MGELLRRLIDREGIPSLIIEVSEETRESLTVFEEATGQEYRFVLPGLELREEEWRQCLSALADLEIDPRFVVASGSLSPGTPSGFYGHVARIAKQRGAKVVLDTSGPPLAAALEEGVYLIKPNLRELSELMDVSLEGEDAWVDACRQLTTTGRAEFVALALGDRGALLVARDHAWRAPALPIKPVSTVGAGRRQLFGSYGVEPRQGIRRGGRISLRRRGGIGRCAVTLGPGCAIGKKLNASFQT